MEKIYIVSYSSGDYEDYSNKIIFATMSKSKATKYVTRFNKILKKWKDYYKIYEEKKIWSNKLLTWIKDEYVEKHYDRWYMLQNINKCRYIEIELR